MKIAVMGAGAVGCYYGAMLARAGHPVTLIGRAQHPRPPAPAPAAAQPASLPVQTLPPIQPAQEIDVALAVPQVRDEPPAKASARPHAVRPHVRVAHRPSLAPACCSAAQVQAADRELRAAYAEAIRAGVPRGEIVAARNRWSAARGHAPGDPARVVASYHDIADDLNRAARSARTYARADSGRFHPRYAAWWR